MLHQIGKCIQQLKWTHTYIHTHTHTHTHTSPRRRVTFRGGCSDLASLAALRNISLKAQNDVAMDRKMFIKIRIFDSIPATSASFLALWVQPILFQTKHVQFRLPLTRTEPTRISLLNPLNPELNPICYLLAILGAHRFLHVSRIRVKLLTFRLLMSYIYGAPILDVSRSHTTTQHSR